MKYKVYSLVVLLCSGVVFADAKTAESFDGKYEFSMEGSNDTETRCSVDKDYLEIDTENYTAIIWDEIDNFEQVLQDARNGIRRGDFGFFNGKRITFTLNIVKDSVELLYKECVSYVVGKENICTEASIVGEKQYVFKKVKGGLKMIWSKFGADKHIFLQVKKTKRPKCGSKSRNRQRLIVRENI